MCVVHHHAKPKKRTRKTNRNYTVSLLVFSFLSLSLFSLSLSFSHYFFLSLPVGFLPLLCCTRKLTVAYNCYSSFQHGKPCRGERERRGKGGAALQGISNDSAIKRIAHTHTHRAFQSAKLAAKPKKNPEIRNPAEIRGDLVYTKLIKIRIYHLKKAAEQSEEEEEREGGRLKGVRQLRLGWAGLQFKCARKLFLQIQIYAILRAYFKVEEEDEAEKEADTEEEAEEDDGIGRSMWLHS